MAQQGPNIVLQQWLAEILLLFLIEGMAFDGLVKWNV